MFNRSSFSPARARIILSSATFKPTDIANLRLWLDFADLSTLFKDTVCSSPVTADGDTVAGVTDKSGNAWHASEATNKPTYRAAVKNGRSVLEFASSQLVTLHFPQFPSKRGAIFIVYDNAVAIKGSLVATYAGAGNNFLLYTTSSGTPKYFYYDGAQVYASVFDLNSTWYLRAFHRDGDTTAKHRRNGALVDELTVANKQQADLPLYIGASTSSKDFTRYIAEVIAYGDISAADVQKVELYLQNKWGLSNPYSDNLILGYGDSVTLGTGASDAAHRWLNLVGSNQHTDILNAGIASTVLQNTTQNEVAVLGGAVTNNGRDTYASRVVAYKPGKVLILYGLNDLRLDDAAFSVSTFYNSYSELLNGLLGAGIQAANIVIGSPPCIPAASYALGDPHWDAGSAEKHAQHVSACQSVALVKGCKYVDVYQWMIDNGGDALISGDGIHPNDAGHAAIANAFLSVL